MYFQCVMWWRETCTLRIAYQSPVFISVLSHLFIIFVFLSSLIITFSFEVSFFDCQLFCVDYSVVVMAFVGFCYFLNLYVC